MTRIRTLIRKAERCLDELDGDRDRVTEYLLLLRTLEANPRVLLRARKMLKAALQDAERLLNKAS